MSETISSSNNTRNMYQPNTAVSERRKQTKNLEKARLREEMIKRAVATNQCWGEGALDECIKGYEERDLKVIKTRMFAWQTLYFREENAYKTRHARTSALDKAYLYGLAWNPIMRSRGNFENFITLNGMIFLTSFNLPNKVFWHLARKSGRYHVSETLAERIIFPEEIKDMLLSVFLDNPGNSMGVALAGRADLPIKVQRKLASRTYSRPTLETLTKNPNVLEEIRVEAGFALLSLPTTD